MPGRLLPHGTRGKGILEGKSSIHRGAQWESPNHRMCGSSRLRENYIARRNFTGLCIWNKPGPSGFSG